MIADEIIRYFVVQIKSTMNPQWKYFMQPLNNAVVAVDMQ